MRLLVSGIVAVAGFVMGALAVAILVPEGPVLVKLILAIVWLLALIFGAFLLGSKQPLSKRDDQRRLLEYGVLAAVLMALFLVPIFIYHINIPKWAARAVLAAIAGAVFLLSRYMQRRKNQRSI
jgi:glucose uptake protein GlcU